MQLIKARRSVLTDMRGEELAVCGVKAGDAGNKQITRRLMLCTVRCVDLRGGIIAIQCCSVCKRAHTLSHTATHTHTQLHTRRATKAVMFPPAGMSLSQIVSCSLQRLNKTKRQTNPPGTWRQRKYLCQILCACACVSYFLVWFPIKK